MSEVEIASLLQYGLDNNTTLYTSAGDNVTGVIVAIPDEENSMLWVEENLAMTLANLKQFAKEALNRFPCYDLQWRKHGICKVHNTNNLYKKLGVI